jgi:hypothetical protein
MKRYIAAITLLCAAVASARAESIASPNLTPEEQALLASAQFMESYHPDEPSYHKIGSISNPKRPDIPPSTILELSFGSDDAEPARKEGRDMAQFHYSEHQAEMFLYLEGWEKYHHDRFFTRAYVQEGMQAFEKALKASGPEPPAKERHSARGR